MNQQQTPHQRPPQVANIVIILLALAAIVLVGIKTVFMPVAPQHDPNLLPFATDQNYESLSTAEARQALLELCASQPEVLAATVSAFPSVITDVAGLSETDPIALDELMDGENAADTQLALLQTLRLLLDAPGVSYQYGKYSGTGDLLYLRMRDPNAKLDPSNLELVWDQAEMKNAKVLIVTANYDDRIREVGYFYLAGGFQRLKPTNGTLK